MALCLIGILAAGAWSLRPASEAELFAQAQPLMESDSPVDWKRAEQQFLKPLLERFPETSHRKEIEAFTDRYDIHRAEERIKNLSRFARLPKSEAEGAFSEAWEYERFGDRMTAWQKYESLVELFGNSEDRDELIYVKLARRQIERIKFDQKSATGKRDFLEEKLAEPKRRPTRAMCSPPVARSTA